MKKILAILSLLALILGLIPQSVYALNNTGYYVVTAYYSPLPDQEYYLTGDYESEKRLNGEGIAGASGKQVFSGMLAGPKTYSFGTKIYLEGLGVGEIADRGGAIVTAGNRGYSHDRIDVWMGYGDEGLKRALYWGKRTVAGYIVNTNTEVSLDYYDIASPSWATNGLVANSSVFSYPLGIGSDVTRVKDLQTFLSDIGLYEGEISGVYNSEVIDIVYDFQIENNLIKPGDLYGAGYWGSATRNKFKKAYLNGEFDKDEIEGVELVEVENIENEVEEVVESGEVIEIQGVEEIVDLSIFDRAVFGEDNIKELQAKLQEIGVYSGELTGNYDDLIDPIYDFQIENNIVSSIYTPGAGSYGPKTRAALKEVYISYTDEITKEEELKAKKEAEELALKQAEEQRKQELEDKYIEIEKFAEELASEKINSIGYLKKGDVSPAVRELQGALKDLGYFEYNDTAIFGNITNESVIAFQIDMDIIESSTDVAAGIVGPKTNAKLKEKLKDKYLDEKVNEADIDMTEVASILGDSVM